MINNVITHSMVLEILRPCSFLCHAIGLLSRLINDISNEFLSLLHIEVIWHCASLILVTTPYLNTLYADEKKTHISLASLLWDKGKQNSPRCDAAERGLPSGAILFAQRNFIEK